MLKDQLDLIQADGNITYGAALMTVLTNNNHYSDIRTEQLKQIFDCIVYGDDGTLWGDGTTQTSGLGCWAWGDFSGTSFEDSQFENVRNIASYNRWNNQTGGRIDFVVPDPMDGIIAGDAAKQAEFYNKIKAALNSLNVSI